MLQKYGFKLISPNVFLEIFLSYWEFNFHIYYMDINLLKKKIFTPSFFAYLCIFAPHFSAIFKEPNLRFESAHLTSSKRLFDELIKAL